MSGWRDIDSYLATRGVRIGAPTPGQTTGGTHAPNSYHYRGQARDYGDANSDCRAVVDALKPFATGPNPVIVELFYAPTNTWLKDGKQLSRAAIGDHDDHVHGAIRADGVLAVDPAPAGVTDDGGMYL